jgi:hypothetical protein
MIDKMRLFKVFIVLLVLFQNHKVFSQFDNAGAGRALSFNGQNDYINFGDVYKDLKIPFTISAWVYFDPSSNASGGPIFANRNCTPIYTGFRLFASPTSISIDCGDGFGGNNPAFRRGKFASVNLPKGQWFHVCSVVRSFFDMDLFVNGMNVGGQDSGTSSFTMDSSLPGFASTAYFTSNNIIYRYKDLIDEILLWNKALSQAEIQQYMCSKRRGTEPGLVGYWNFDETSGNTVYDKSPNKFNGQFVGSPTRVYSGAPIGDISVNLYPSSWNGISLTISESNNKITINNVIGAPGGCHLYAVRNSPSQTIGINPSNSENLYFGVFMASLNTGNKFNVAYTFNDTNPCLFERQDNSSSTWTTSILPLNGKSQRIELIKGSGNQIIVNLGPDQTLCDQTNYTLNSGNIPVGTAILWNTGQITPTIQINKSGKYWLQASSSCEVGCDTIIVQFLKTPTPFSFGADIESCKVSPTILKPAVDDFGVDYMWQDGSKLSSFDVRDFGKYWVSVKNFCGQVSDTIKFSKISSSSSLIPNVITPNGDAYNQYFQVDSKLSGLISLLVVNRWGREVYFSDSYKNDWDGGDLANGVYFGILTGECIEKTKTSITIIR